MKKRESKLTVTRETIRPLDSHGLAKVQGGYELGTLGPSSLACFNFTSIVRSSKQCDPTLP